jgi:hypothetical protein
MSRNAGATRRKNGFYAAKEWCAMAEKHRPRINDAKVYAALPKEGATPSKAPRTSERGDGSAEKLRSDARGGRDRHRRRSKMRNGELIDAVRTHE